MKKSNLYKIHRYLSIVCLIPVLFWCISGLLHPIMANWFRINPAHRGVPIIKIDTSKVEFTVKEVALQNGITAFNDVGFKVLNKQPYYVFTTNNRQQFFNATTGDELKNGVDVYATDLAKYYLGKKDAEITKIAILDSFTDEYKIINRHLPVYKVSFNDIAKSDVFVHLPSGSLGTINDRFKRAYLWVFSNFHNWDFLGDNHSLKPFLIFSLSFATFIVGVLGLYIYIINRKKYKKRIKDVVKLKKRNLHRYIAVPASVFFLMFSFSGAYHAFQKFEVYDLNQHQPKINFTNENLNQDILKSSFAGKIQRLSLVKINETSFYRLSFFKNPVAEYYDVNTLEKLKNGDEVYAIQRAIEITGLSKSNITEVNLITKYQNEYGFINKRLPVYEIVFNDDLDSKSYIETASGIPGSLINKNKKREALSFIMLHKFHFLDFIGKGNRDIVISLAILSILLVLGSGLRVFIQIIKKK